MGERIYLNNDWEFTADFQEEMLHKGNADGNWQAVRLPHTCKETPLHYFDEQVYQMVCGYRKSLMVPKEWQGKKVLLTIEGAAHDSEVYLNGEKVGEHHCGYTAFMVDLTGLLDYGKENLLVVRVDSREHLNIPPFGYVIDYMTYGGIYRNVYLEIKNQVYLRDVFVHNKLNEADDAPQGKPEESGTPAQSQALLISEVALNRRKVEGYSARQYIRLKGTEDFRELGEAEVKQGKAHICFLLEEVFLWDTEHPSLYEVKTELLYKGAVVDEKIVTTGFRQAEFRTDGFYLNGEKVRIRGLNRHQSYPYVGYAMPRSMQQLDADILKKELGVNAVRTSHYPQSHDFLDRCDELGLLVFTEIPGWQHIGDREWKKQAIRNVRDMVLQYRNHTSIILWGVRINESQDDDAFYKKTNEVAHRLDETRQTGGVRAHKKSHLFEDVYTYNDFSHDGSNHGCEPKAKITSEMDKPYLISEFNGHMYPTKAFDWEEHRREQAIRYANVLDAVAGESDIAGCFGWCMFDYNTHKDFGSGDRICYHGVLDMFRNHKLAAAVYACQQEEEPVLEVTSSMDIGEHPGCFRGKVYIITNADSVRMYKNDYFIKEFTVADSPYQNMAHGPMLIDDYIGGLLEENEDFAPAQARDVKDALNTTSMYGLNHLPKSVYVKLMKLMAVYHMKLFDAYELYNKYIGDWGGSSRVYRFEAIKDGKVVKTVLKKPMTKMHIEAQANHKELVEEHTYDVAAIRIQAMDENGNILHACNDPLVLKAEGPVEIIGPSIVSLQGGLGGTYVRTVGKAGKAKLTIEPLQADAVQIEMNVAIKTVGSGR